MSKLALMYACGDCFNYKSKKKEELELSDYTGVGRRRSGGGHQTQKDHRAGRGADAQPHQDASVHGTDPQQADDHGDCHLLAEFWCTLTFMRPTLSPALPGNTLQLD